MSGYAPPLLIDMGSTTSDDGWWGLGLAIYIGYYIHTNDGSYDLW